MRSHRIVLLIAALLTLLVPSIPQAQSPGLAESIIEVVAAAAAQRFPEARVEIDEPELPAFVIQQPCASPEIEVRTTQVLHRVPVAIRCPAVGNWSAFVTVTVNAWLPAPTACSNIARGRRLTASDLCMRELNLAGQSTQTITDRNQLIGRETRRPLITGTAFTHAAVGPPKLVSRGDTVRLLAGNQRIVIATQAAALADGRLGQQIRVENLRSGKRLRAWVTGPGRVSTRAPTP
ncbi:MAG: flagellar basal body P-ring formation chaperone FlgA [Pseudomonadota bacterium]